MKLRKLLLIVVALFSIGMLTMIVACNEGTTKKSSKKSSKSSKSKKPKKFKLAGAYRISETEIEATLKFKQPVLSVDNFVVYEFGDTENPIKPKEVKVLKKGKIAILVMPQLNGEINYNIGLIGLDPKKNKIRTNFIEAQWGDKLLNTWYSSDPMGCTVSGGKTIFRVFSPRAKKVILCLFDKPYTKPPGKERYKMEEQREMTKDPSTGVWKCSIKDTLWGKLYGYRLTGPKGGTEMFDPSLIIADPYSKATAVLQIAPQSHLSVIIDPSKYKWGSKKKYMNYEQEEYIVYEMNVRDLTMLSKNVTKKGTYEGLAEDGKEGGLAHIKSLGVNAIELLPIQDFNEIEAPYKVKSKKHVYNTWNTYGRNHWGYMTSFFLAPEPFYYGGKINAGKWIGVSGGQIFAFKSLVDKMHQNGIAVVMDVVYNHTSQYDRNALKYIDKKYYFWITGMGTDDSRSGCGNDYQTDRPMSRKLVVDSTKYWVEEYRIDGYRFDLGTLIDWKTYDAIKKAVYSVHPKTFLVAEPWMGGRGEPRDGGGYSPKGMAKHGIAAWNDKIRPTIKGQLWKGSASFNSLKTGVKAYPNVLREPKYSLSYVESHDNDTLSDKIRKDTRAVKPKAEIAPKDYLKIATLDEKQMQYNKISIFYLMTVQGAVMIHEGMEFARMKIVYPPSGQSVFPPNTADWQRKGKKWFNMKQIDAKATAKRKARLVKKGEMKADEELKPPLYAAWSTKAAPLILDHDSYEKDNECNWLNWKLKKINIELFNYYKGMIALRKKNSKSFGLYPIDKIEFSKGKAESKSGDMKTAKNTIGYFYDKKVSGKKSFFVALNGNKTKEATFTLPAGKWTVVVDGKSSNIKKGKTYDGTVEVPKLTGMILAQ